MLSTFVDIMETFEKAGGKKNCFRIEKTVTLGGAEAKADEYEKIAIP